MREQFLFGPWLRADSRNQTGARWLQPEMMQHGGGKGDKVASDTRPTSMGYDRNQIPKYGGHPTDDIESDEGKGVRGVDVNGKDSDVESLCLKTMMLG
ncbi:hypothetical protein JCGZ_05798 [Jatropha curcas]|uniref:Uncharacterized protein n=1 Tax=Jatropha curcas TaxID=180498 RepID=A0A067L2G6_JATCU|nr:hypothetical protein JCGZ_05798 [Jatropha curcas]